MATSFGSSDNVRDVERFDGRTARRGLAAALPCRALQLSPSVDNTLELAGMAAYLQCVATVARALGAVRRRPPTDTPRPARQ